MHIQVMRQSCPESQESSDWCNSLASQPQFSHLSHLAQYFTSFGGHHFVLQCAKTPTDMLFALAMFPVPRKAILSLNPLENLYTSFRL